MAAEWSAVTEEEIEFARRFREMEEERRKKAEESNKEEDEKGA